MWRLAECWWERVIDALSVACDCFVTSRDFFEVKIFPQRPQTSENFNLAGFAKKAESAFI